MKYPIYKAKYPINVIDGIDIDTVYFTPLSKRDVVDLYSMFNSSKNLHILKTLEASLSDITVIDFLSDKEVHSLYKKILKISIPEKQDLELFKDLFRLGNDPILKSETWNCDVCKERGLQSDRACGFIPENERDKSFQIYVAGNIYKQCPIYYMLEYQEMLQAGYEAYKYYRKGLMPEPGGMYDQTMWFIELSILTDNLIKQQQAEALKKDN